MKRVALITFTLWLVVTLAWAGTQNFGGVSFDGSGAITATGPSVASDFQTTNNTSTVDADDAGFGDATRTFHYDASTGFLTLDDGSVASIVLRGDGLAQFERGQTSTNAIKRVAQARVIADGVTPIAGFGVGWSFTGSNDTSDGHTMATFDSLWASPADGNEFANVQFQALRGGALAPILVLGNSDTVGGNDRVEANGDLIFPTDDAEDIGEAGDNRPRSIFVGTSVVSPVLTGDGTGALGGYTRSLEAVSGTPHTISSAESGRLFTNEGASAIIVHTLPTAVAGLQYSFTVQDADGIRVTANTDDTIRLDGVVSAAAGTIESTEIGASIHVLAINAIEWFVHILPAGSRGNWQVDSTATGFGAFASFGFTGGSTATGVITPGTPVEIAGTAVDNGSSGWTIATATGGRATYNGLATRNFKITATLSATASVSNQVVTIFIAKDGTEVASTTRTRKIGTGSDVGMFTTDLISSTATNAFYEVFVDIDGGASPTITAIDVGLTITSASSD